MELSHFEAKNRVGVNRVDKMLAKDVPVWWGGKPLSRFDEDDVRLLSSTVLHTYAATSHPISAARCSTTVQCTYCILLYAYCSLYYSYSFCVLYVLLCLTMFCMYCYAYSMFCMYCYA